MSQTHFRARPVKPSLAHRISNAKQWSGTACGIDHYDCTRILRQVTCSACWRRPSTPSAAGARQGEWGAAMKATILSDLSSTHRRDELGRRGPLEFRLIEALVVEVDGVKYRAPSAR